jgi:hypothetical protein
MLCRHAPQSVQLIRFAGRVDSKRRGKTTQAVIGEQHFEFVRRFFFLIGYLLELDEIYKTARIAVGAAEEVILRNAVAKGMG